MAAAVARKKEDMVMKLKRLTDKQVCTCMLVASVDIVSAFSPCQKRFGSVLLGHMLQHSP